MMMMMVAVGGLKRSLCVVLSLMLLSAACNAKKLWGVDVGKKEEKGEFASLLNKAAGIDNGAGPGSSGVGDEVGSMLASIADADLSSWSLSELCTKAIDVVLDTVKNEEFISQFAEPGVIGDIVRGNEQMAALLGDQGETTEGLEELIELLKLEGSPTLYKTKFYNLVDKLVGNIVSLRMDVSDPRKLRNLIRDWLLAAGLDEATIGQIMEIVEHPEILAQQITELARNPAVVEQITSTLEGMMGAYDEVAGNDELMEMLAAMQEEDPEMMEQMLAELMKDPEFAESLLGEGATGGGDFFKGIGGGAGRPGHAVEL